MAIDPGPTQSGFVLIYEDGIIVPGVLPNEQIPALFQSLSFLVIERMGCYGKRAIGDEVFDSAMWIGQFIRAFERENIALIYRRNVVLHTLGSNHGGDSWIRQALIARYGGKDKAVGKKSAQGPLFYVKSHAWQALALGLYAIDKRLFDAAKEWNVPI
jgi:hypothetical protein